MFRSKIRFVCSFDLDLNGTKQKQEHLNNLIFSVLDYSMKKGNNGILFYFLPIDSQNNKIDIKKLKIEMNPLKASGKYFSFKLGDLDVDIDQKDADKIDLTKEELLFLFQQRLNKYYREEEE